MNIVQPSLLPTCKHNENKFTVACSGGVDSVVLVHVLHALRYNFDIVHFNHNLRSQNDLMQTAVEKLGRKLEINVQVHTRPKSENNSESDLRSFRMDWYNKINRDIIQGHHLDDAVESYLMNTFKGVPEHVPIDPTSLLNSGYGIWRPMIMTRKEDIIDYADFHHLGRYIVEDETNSHNCYYRNMIRNQVLPLVADKGLAKVVKKKFYLQ